MTTTTTTTIGINLRRYRKDAGLTLEDVAERTGMSTAKISRIENGLTAAKMDVLQKFAEIYGLDNVYKLYAPPEVVRQDAMSTGDLLPKEIDLIRLFRAADGRGRKIILQVAQAVKLCGQYTAGEVTENDRQQDEDPAE